MSEKFSIPYDYPSGEQLCADPVIHSIDDFASEAEICAVQDAARSGMQRAQVSLGQGGTESAGRTGQNCWVDPLADEVIRGLSERVASLVGIPLDYAESLQVIHYGPSQEYAPHFDAWQHDSAAGQRCMKRGGQRLVTGLLYLNAVQAGGGTTFPKLSLTVAPKPGRLVIFHNCVAGTNQRHPLSLHGGMPVLQGEKWACNFWFRETPYRRSTVTRTE